VKFVNKKEKPLNKEELSDTEEPQSLEGDNDIER